MLSFSPNYALTVQYPQYNTVHHAWQDALESGSLPGHFVLEDHGQERKIESSRMKHLVEGFKHISFIVFDKFAIDILSVASGY